MDNNKLLDSSKGAKLQPYSLKQICLHFLLLISMFITALEWYFESIVFFAAAIDKHISNRNQTKSDFESLYWNDA